MPKAHQPGAQTCSPQHRRDLIVAVLVAGDSDSGPDGTDYLPAGHKAGHTGNENGPPDAPRRAVLPGSGGGI